MSDPIFDKLLASEQGKAGGPAPGGTVFDSLMGMEQRRGQQLLGQLNQAVDVNPDKFSEEKKTAQFLNQPTVMVQTLPEDSARQAKIKTIQDNTANAPVLKQQYTDADFAKLAHDDSAPLSAIEALVGVAKYVTSAPDAPRGGLLSDIGGAARSLVSGAPRLSGGLWGAGAAIPGVLGMTDAEQWMLQQQKNAQGLANRIQGLDPKAGLVEKSVMSGFQSAGQNLMLLPFGLARGATEIGTTAILTAMGLSTGGEAYGKAREKGVNPYTSLAYGIEDAAAEVVFEKYLGVGGLLQNIKAGAGAGKLFVYELSKELPGEVATTLVQNFNEWMNVNPDKSVAQFVAEQPEAIAQTVIATLVGGGTQIGAVKTAEKVLGTFADPEAQRQAAEAQRAMLAQLSELAASSKLKARDSETFQRFMDAATDGTPVQDLYIGASVLAQSGIAEQLAQALPTVAEQLPAALASDGFVRIPTAQYAAVIAGTPIEQAVIDHVKVDPNGYTFAESKEYAASFNQEMQTQLEKALIEREADTAFKSERDQVRDEFLGQLNQAKRFTEDVNGAYASMLANFYAVTAAKLGMTPRELVDRYQLNVAGREQRAAQFDQDGKLLTDTPEFKGWFGESVLKDAENKPLVLYHGTSDAIEAFDLDHPNRKDTGWLGTGVYLTDDDHIAESYARLKPGADGPNVMPLYAKLENPYMATLEDKQRLKNLGREGADAFTAELKAKGHDGVILEFDGGGREIVVFDPAGVKSVFNRGMFDPSDPNILNQAGVDQTELPGFIDWSHGHPVVRLDEPHTFRSGEGVVVEALHGTTGDFDTFVREKANIESDLGGGFYFTNNPADVGENYAGLGPDLTNKVERLAEQIASETDREYNDPDVVAEARAQFMANEGFAMPVFVRFDNPVVLGGEGETFLEYREPYDEEADEYGEPEGELVNFVEALRDVASEYTDADADAAMSGVWERVSDYEGIKVSELIEALKTSEGLQYATDENGTLANSEIIRRAFEQIGYDGFIDQTVNQKFGSEKRIGKPMEGMDENTVHFIAFKPDQIASRIGSTWTRENAGDSILKQGARGQIFFGQDITETPSVIALLEKADLSTFLHESGHFFLQVQADLAARIQAQINDGATVTDGERSIIEDMAKLLDWMGVKADQDGSALDAWMRMTIDEQREYHEKFARGFEAYAFEGRAPTMELQGIFQRFRAWLLNLYRDLKSLNVELTDEVRIVMDRMLATNEQIEAAEAARNMGPLFNAQNAQGLIDNWQAYHELANEATQAAVDQLQAKSLKELQWASRAKTRVLKDLQKQHNAIRAELKMEARREVMSQPIYRAWQFLTAKLSKEDRAALKPERERKSLPGTLDPSLDSLFVAIAKLGGLDRAQVESQWGWDKKERTPSPVFGKPLLRREDGLGLDAMGELLAQYGYLPTDEHGKYDMADFEEAFDAEYRGTPVYSIEHDYSNAMGDARPGEGLSLENIGAGRLDMTSLKMVGVDDAVIDRLVGYNMTGKDGIHPDIVADMIVDENGAPVFSSGNELAQRLAEATPMKVAIEKLTDQMMLERFGELATPEAIQQAADQAIHNELRAKMLHAEARALERAMDVKEPGRRGVALLPQAARNFAQRLIAGLKVRDIRPAQYAAAEVRAAKAAERAFAKNDLEGAAEQKRVQIINNYAAREAYAAQEEVRQAVAYLRKFDKRSKTLDPDYYDQIVAILERFDLVPSTTLKAIDQRTSLAAWLRAQEEQGIVPEIPPEIAVEAFRKSYKDMTVEELRGLRDTIKQIDHLGRLKAKLLTALDAREFAEIRDDIAESIRENSKGRVAENRTPNTVLGEKLAAIKKFWASHIKAATWARIMDGGKDGGPVWEYLIRTANAAGDKEVGLREQATKDLSALVAPVLAQGKMGGKGEFFPTIGRSLNKEARLAIALNIGNESNAQRLLGGEGWTVEQIKPVLDTLTTADWNFVQAVWDYFESYRPEIAAKERRVYGSEPQWIEARPLTVQSRDGDTINLRGGYYPVKYDPRASERAESHMEAEDAKRMMQGAYTSATTRRSFTKQRAEAVVGRPLLYSLDGLYNGVNEVIHDLSWHEWLIDANRIIKNPKIAEAMRDTYGAEVHQQFKNWLKDVAEGERGAQKAGEDALAWIRQGTSVAGLGINVMSALMQPFGITQSMVRIGSTYVGRGIAKAIADPVGANAEINGMSEFMRTRSLTRMRELAELRNQVKGQTKTRANIDAAAYALMLRAQQLVDVPTWWGAYEKAIAEGNGQDRAAALADQAVIDAQGGGTVKDLSAIERGGPALKLFTTFYSFMNTSLNLGVAQVMTRESKAKLAADMLLIYVVPVILIELMKSAFTPGDSGDWEDPEKAALKMIKAEVSYLFGLVFGLRELSGIVDAVQGKPSGEYSGPAGTRIIGDTLKLAKQIGQGEMDDGLRKSIVNVTGELLRLPAAQVNRSITGAKALVEGETKNPAALVFGYEEPR